MHKILSKILILAMMTTIPSRLLAGQTDNSTNINPPKVENPSGLEKPTPKTEENPSGLEDLSPEAEQEIQDTHPQDPFEKHNPYEAYDPFKPKEPPKSPAQLKKEEDQKQRRRDRSRYLSDEKTLRQNEKRNEDKNRYHMRVPEKPDRYQKYDRDKD